MRFRAVLAAAAVIAAILPFTESASAQDSSSPHGGKPVIEAIQGDRIVVVIAPGGENRVGQAGTVIEFGDSIKTGPHATAKIAYPDGSKLLIGRATTMAVLAKSGDTHRGEVIDGRVRGIITKQKFNKLSNNKPKFVFKTKSATMGVRGTDFVFSSDPAAGSVELRTLEGLVEVGKDEATVMEGKGRLVNPNQMITADQAGLGAVSPFDGQAYLASLQQAEPGMQTLLEGEDVPSADTSWEDKRLDLLNFFANGAMIGQGPSNQDGKVSTVQAGWSPRLRLWGRLGLRGHVSAYPLLAKATDGADKGQMFPALEFGALLSVQAFGPLMLEAGGGGNTWLGGHSDGLGPLLMANVVWRFRNSKLVDRLFLGVTMMDVRVGNQQDLNTSQIGAGGLRAGFGFRF